MINNLFERIIHKKKFIRVRLYRCLILLLQYFENFHLIKTLCHFICLTFSHLKIPVCPIEVHK